LGEHYGFVTIASILALLTPRLLNVMMPNTWTCSAVAAEALRAGGWLHNWPDVFQVKPSDLWKVVT
jgi:hypothetical protein